MSISQCAHGIWLSKPRQIASHDLNPTAPQVYCYKLTYLRNTTDRFSDHF